MLSDRIGFLPKDSISGELVRCCFSLLLSKMPSYVLNTNVSADKVTQAFLADLSKLVSKVTGKPESVGQLQTILIALFVMMFQVVIKFVSS